MIYAAGLPQLQSIKAVEFGLLYINCNRSKLSSSKP